MKPKEKSIVLIYENKIEYTLYPDQMPCEKCIMSSVEKCSKCNRVRAEGIAKIPTGRTLLLD